MWIKTCLQIWEKFNENSEKCETGSNCKNFEYYSEKNKKWVRKPVCKKDETFNYKQEKCISSPQCKSSEYYSQRLKRCLTKRRCYPPKEFNKKTEKCEEKVNGGDKCKSNEYYN